MLIVTSVIYFTTRLFSAHLENTVQESFIGEESR